MGLVGTMAAPVLGLLIASAKTSYDRLSDDLAQISANIILLDRVLAHYGPEAKGARDQLRRFVVCAVDATTGNYGVTGSSGAISTVSVTVARTSIVPGSTGVCTGVAAARVCILSA